MTPNYAPVTGNSKVASFVLIDGLCFTCGFNVLRVQGKQQGARGLPCPPLCGKPLEVFIFCHGFVTAG